MGRLFECIGNAKHENTAMKIDDGFLNWDGSRIQQITYKNHNTGENHHNDSNRCDEVANHIREAIEQIYDFIHALSDRNL